MSNETIDLDYEPHEKQRILHEARAQQILYGGAAGGGKSHAMRWDAYGACLENPGCDAYLFRRTRVQLENTHVKRVSGDIPSSLAKYNAKKNRLEFYNGSFLNFAYAETEQDVNNYDSVEFHWLGLDEAGHFTEYQISYLRSRMRIGDWKPKQDIFPRLIMSANPGGVSHHFLKAEFMDPSPPMKVFESGTMVSKVTGKGWDTLFIPARMKDNPSLDEGYDAAFSGLPEWKQAMLVDGDWDVIAGAYFDCFSRDINVIEPFSLPAHLLRFTSMDGGFALPFAIGWYAVMDGETYTPDGLLLPQGALVKYREWYGCQRNKQGTALNKGIRMRAGEIARLALGHEAHEKIVYRVGDPAMWRSDGGPSTAETMARAGWHMRQADRERVEGWKRTYEMLDGTDEETGHRIPMLYVTSNCVDTIRTIPTLQSSEKDMDDVAKQGEDHLGDETRYACMSRPHVRSKQKKRETLVNPITFDDLMRWEDGRLARKSPYRLI